MRALSEHQTIEEKTGYINLKGFNFFKNTFVIWSFKYTCT